MKDRKSSKAFDLVVPSFLEIFLNDTTTLASLIEERSDGSARYDSLEDVVAKPTPNPAPVALAARALEACDVNCRFPIVSRVSTSC